jgi:FkbM family methyltransferase
MPIRTLDQMSSPLRVIHRARHFVKRPDVSDAPFRYAVRRLVSPSLAMLPSARVRQFRIKDGLRMRADITDVVGRNLYTHGVFEWEVHQTLIDLLEPGMSFIDVGAHIGSFTVPMARHVGCHGRVVAVEPDGINRALLESNLLLNDMSTRVQVLDVAALDRRVEMPLGLASASNTGSARLGNGTRAVQCVPLDEVDAVAALQRLDVIKLDVEGFEAQAIMGMKNAIQRHRPSILLEVNGPEALELLSHEFGYSISIIEMDGAFTEWTGGCAQLTRANDTVNALARPIQ